MTKDRRYHLASVFNSYGYPEYFTVPRRYVNLKYISSGAQGIVVSADDTVSKERVAIKKLINPFDHPVTARRTYREMVLLSGSQHKNIIELRSVFTPNKNVNDFTEIYLVMELFPYNLHAVARTHNLKHNFLSYFVYQLLCAVNHLHKEGIIHRDLKPSNVVVNEHCDLKILDFGLARIQPEDGRMSNCVVTRHYRAPEVIIEQTYNEKVDVWSIGCIFGELIKRRTLFPGINVIEQWMHIINALGTPSDEFMRKSPEANLKFIRNLEVRSRKEMDELFPDDMFVKESEDPENNLTASDARHLLNRLLAIDPAERYSVADALNDPYVRRWNTNKEVNTPSSGLRYNKNLDTVELSIDEWKTVIFEDIKEFCSDVQVFGDCSAVTEVPIKRRKAQTV